MEGAATTGTTGARRLLDGVGCGPDIKREHTDSGDTTRLADQREWARLAGEGRPAVAVTLAAGLYVKDCRPVAYDPAAGPPQQDPYHHFYRAQLDQQEPCQTDGGTPSSQRGLANFVSNYSCELAAFPHNMHEEPSPYPLSGFYRAAAPAPGGRRHQDPCLI
jgi:hypothetical protein